MSSYYNEEDKRALHGLLLEGFVLFPLKISDDYKTSKAPDTKGSWQGYKMTQVELDGFLNQNRKLGIPIPLDSVVVDIDRPDDAPAIQSDCYMPTKNGSHHWYLATDKSQGINRNQGWGETLQGGKAYAVAHNPAILYSTLQDIKPLPDELAEALSNPQTSRKEGLEFDTTAGQFDWQTGFDDSMTKAAAALAGLHDEQLVRRILQGLNHIEGDPITAKAFEAKVAWWAKCRDNDAGFKEQPAETPLDDLICSLDFATMEIDPLDYIVPGVALGSSMLITGQSGLGKSIYTLDTFLKVASCRPELEWLIIDSEMTPRTVKERIGSAGLPNLFYKFVNHDPKIWEYDVTRFAGVAIDTVSGAHSSKFTENDAEYWTQPGAWVKRLMTNNQFACITHHEGKEARYGARGNSAAMSMFEIAVSITGNMDEVKLKLTKNRHGTIFPVGEIEIKWNIKETRPKHSYI